MKISTKKQILTIIKKEGFNSLKEFINSWIKRGETFKSLQDWLEIEHNITYSPQTTWALFRNYLTIPYSAEDQFWYKWNAIAGIKGFTDATQMIFIFRQRHLSLKEISDELGVHPTYACMLLNRFSKPRTTEQSISKRVRVRRHKGEKAKDHDGFTRQDCRDWWKSKLSNLGFRSLREAIHRLKQQKLTYKEMAKLFGVTSRVLQTRRKRAGLLKNTTYVHPSIQRHKLQLQVTPPIANYQK